MLPGQKTRLHATMLALFNKPETDKKEIDPPRAVNTYPGKATPILQILDRARWAPSPDNIQPWQFQILSETQADIILLPEDDHLLSINNTANLQSLGIFIETARLAATAMRYRIDIESIETPPHIKAIRIIRLTIIKDANVPLDHLHSFIETRSVSRNHYQRTLITPEHKAALQKAVGEHFDILYFEGPQKNKLQKIRWIDNKTRLSWHAVFKNYRRVVVLSKNPVTRYLPIHTLGLTFPARTLLKYVLKDWYLFKFVQQYLGGSLLGFFELEFLPNLFCGANILLIAKKIPKTEDDAINSGIAIQRFWLAATMCGILHQPSYSHIVMNAYAKKGIADAPHIEKLAKAQRKEWSRILGSDHAVDKLVWAGRIGYGTPRHVRSLRLPLKELIMNSEPKTKTSR